MNPLSTEWITEAENDFATALRELRVRRTPNYDAVCFHAEQCIEKYLKARHQEANLRLGTTHDLTAHLDLLIEVEPSWGAMRQDLRALTVFAVEYRYPGAFADKTTAQDAVRICRRVRETMREGLGLNS